MDTLDKDKKSMDKIKASVLKYIESSKDGVSVWDLVTNNVSSYEDGCQSLTELEVDGKIKSDVSTLWVSTSKVEDKVVTKSV